jgi:hypothetical protein
VTFSAAILRWLFVDFKKYAVFDARNNSVQPGILTARFILFENFTAPTITSTNRHGGSLGVWHPARQAFAEDDHVHKAVEMLKRSVEILNEKMGRVEQFIPEAFSR